MVYLPQSPRILRCRSDPCGSLARLVRVDRWLFCRALISCSITTLIRCWPRLCRRPLPCHCGRQSRWLVVFRSSTQNPDSLIDLETRSRSLHEVLSYLLCNLRLAGRASYNIHEIVIESAHALLEKTCYVLLSMHGSKGNLIGKWSAPSNVTVSYTSHCTDYSAPDSCTTSMQRRQVHSGIHLILLKYSEDLLLHPGTLLCLECLWTWPKYSQID